MHQPAKIVHTSESFDAPKTTSQTNELLENVNTCQNYSALPSTAPVIMDYTAATVTNSGVRLVDSMDSAKPVTANSLPNATTEGSDRSDTAAVAAIAPKSGNSEQVNAENCPDFTRQFIIALENETVRNHLSNIIGNSLQSEITECKQAISTLEIENINLRKDLEDIKQYTRRNSIRIYNPNWPEHRGENTDQLVLNLAREFNLDIQAHDISRSHRVGPPNSRNPRPILVAFIGYRPRERFLGARRSINSKYRNIHINEDLTKQTSDLAYRARCVRRSNQIHDTWVRDGKVFVKLHQFSNPFVLRDESHLHDNVGNPQPQLSFAGAVGRPQIQQSHPPLPPTTAVQVPPQSQTPHGRPQSANGRHMAGGISSVPITLVSTATAPSFHSHGTTSLISSTAVAPSTNATAPGYPTIPPLPSTVALPPPHATVHSIYGGTASTSPACNGLANAATAVGVQQVASVLASAGNTRGSNPGNLALEAGQASFAFGTTNPNLLGASTIPIIAPQLRFSHPPAANTALSLLDTPVSRVINTSMTPVPYLTPVQYLSSPLAAGTPKFGPPIHCGQNPLLLSDTLSADETLARHATPTIEDLPEDESSEYY